MVSTLPTAEPTMDPSMDPTMDPTTDSTGDDTYYPDASSTDTVATDTLTDDPTKAPVASPANDSEVLSEVENLTTIVIVFFCVTLCLCMVFVGGAFYCFRSVSAKEEKTT